MNETPSPLAVSVPVAAKMCGINRSTLYMEIAAGRRLIALGDLPAWIDGRRRQEA